MPVLRRRNTIVLCAAALLLLFGAYWYWSILQEAHRLDAARSRLADVLSRTGRSILVSHNEVVRIPLLGKSLHYEIRWIGEPPSFRGRQLRLAPAGKYDALKRELFYGQYVDLTRPNRPSSTIGEFALSRGGDLYAPDGRQIFQYSLSSRPNPYLRQDNQPITLPPVGFVQHDDVLDIVGLGLPDSMAHTAEESWSARIKLIARKPVNGNAGEAAAIESFQVILAELSEFDRKPEVEPWHCPIASESDQNDQLGASAPLLWTGCRLVCSCKVSAERGGCHASALFDLSVLLEEPVCGHPTPSTPDTAELSCTAQSFRIAERNNICTSACDRMISTEPGPFTAVRSKKDTLVQVHRIWSTKFAGCSSYERSLDEARPAYCDIRTNDDYSAWSVAGSSAYSREGTLKREFGAKNPGALIADMLKSCSARPPASALHQPAGESARRSEDKAALAQTRQAGTGGVCRAPGERRCSIDTLVEDSPEGGRGQRFIYYTPAMRIGRGEQCSDYNLHIKNLNRSTNTWDLADAQEGSCSISEDDPCRCSCQMKLEQGLPETLRDSNNVERIRVLVAKDVQQDQLCGTQVTIALR